MDTAERLLQLLGLLQSRADWPAGDLAERLGVTTRTIRRDITRLRAYGYPVEAFAGHGGGYRFGPGGHLPPLLLDDRETLAVALGLRVATLAAISGIEDASVSALAKIEQLLPARLRPRLEHLDSMVFTDKPSGTSADRRVFSALTRAATLRITARFSYADHQNAVSERHVEPVRLVRSRDHWYLVAYDMDRAAWRTFRVDRVADVNLTERRFNDRPGPDPTQLVRRSVPQQHYAHHARIELDASATEARQRISPAVARIESLGETSCLLFISTDDLAWLARYLLSLSWTFVAVEPAGLRVELRRFGRALARRHAG